MSAAVDSVGLTFLMLGEPSYMGLIAAFLAGIKNMLLPCAIGALPVMIGYMGGYGPTGGWAIFRQAGGVLVGFCAVYSALGIMAAQSEQSMAALVAQPWYFVVALLVMGMGFSLIRGRALPDHPASNALAAMFPFLLGGLLALTSSPCGTPALSMILYRIREKNEALYGAQNLFSYAMGQFMFVLAAGWFAGLLRLKAVPLGIADWIARFSGWLLILAGGLRMAQAAAWAMGMQP